MSSQRQQTMVMTKEESRQTLLTLWNAGHQDPKYLAKKSQLHLATVYRLIGRIKTREGVQRRQGSGRPRLLKGNFQRRVTALASHNPLMSCAAIGSEAAKRGNPKVSPMTIWRSLRRAGYLKWTPRVIPVLTDRHKRRRVEWCRANINRDWSRVLFTDESYFQLFRNKAQMWGKTRPQKETPKWGPAIMVWGGISARGTTTLKMTRGSITAERYQEIINENLVTIEILYPDGFQFQQDNASAHTARSTREWFVEEGIDLIEWPACSPDLNCIENLWQIMKHALEKETERSIDNWMQKIQDIWDEIVPKHLESLINSMPRRLELCIAANGGKIKY